VVLIFYLLVHSWWAGAYRQSRNWWSNVRFFCVVPLSHSFYSELRASFLPESGGPSEPEYLLVQTWRMKEGLKQRMAHARAWFVASCTLNSGLSDPPPFWLFTERLSHHAWNFRGPSSCVAVDGVFLFTAVLRHLLGGACSFFHFTNFSSRGPLSPHHSLHCYIYLVRVAAPSDQADTRCLYCGSVAYPSALHALYGVSPWKSGTYTSLV